MPSTQDYSPPLGGTIHQLEIKPIFDRLPVREKLYAHHLAQAAWHGSPAIFGFITDLYRACDGQWEALIEQCSITQEELAAFLEYLATFLRNLGNRYVRHAEQAM
jgi:dipeptidyl-peptidase-3